MRIVLVFVLALMGFGAFAQEGSQYIGTKEGAVRVRGTLYADSGFYLPKRPLRSARIYDTGAVYYQLSDSSAYVWTGSQWNKIGASSSFYDSTLMSSTKRLRDTANAIRAAIPVQFNPIAGTNITLSGTYPNITINSSGSSSGNSTNSLTGDGTVGTPFKLVNDAASPGKRKSYRTDVYGTKEWGDIYDAQTMYGIIYNKSSWTSDLADFRTGGAWGTSGTNIICAGGVNDFSRVLMFKDNTNLEKWKLTARVIIATPSGTTYGFGMGVQSVNANGGQPGLAGKVDLTNGVNSGRIEIFAGEGMGVKATASSTLSFSASDRLLLTLERDVDTARFTVKNLTTNATEIVLTYAYPQPESFSTIVFPPNTGELGLINYGGSHTIDSIVWFTKEPKYADLMWDGDSKTQGLYAQRWRNRMGEQIGKLFNTSIIHAGSYDQTRHTRATLTEILRLKPKQFLMTSMSNDARFGVSLATTLANISMIYDSLTNIGTDVYFALFPENAGTNQTNQLILLDTLNDLYPGRVINTMGDLLNKPGSIYTPDGVHLSEIGNAYAVESIINSGKLKYGKPDAYSSKVDKEAARFTFTAKYTAKPYLTAADSLSIPYKLYVDSLVAASTSGGSSTPYLDSVLAKGGRFSTNRTISMGGYNLTLDSVGLLKVKKVTTGSNGIEITDIGDNTTLRIPMGSQGGQGYNNIDFYNYTGLVNRISGFGHTLFNAGNVSIGSSSDAGSKFNLTGSFYRSGIKNATGTYKVKVQLSDSTEGQATLADLSTAMGTDTMYAKRGVTVSADSIVLDNTTETITSGTTTTIANATHVVIVDPASVLASHTITLPAAPYDKQEVAIYFGGTVAGNATVVTTLTISANTGQALMQKAAPSTALGGDCFIYKYVSSNAKWYRKQ